MAPPRSASGLKDSDRYKVANCIQAQPVFLRFARLAHGKVICVSVLGAGCFNGGSAVVRYGESADRYRRSDPADAQQELRPDMRRPVDARGLPRGRGAGGGRRDRVRRGRAGGRVGRRCATPAPPRPAPPRPARFPVRAAAGHGRILHRLAPGSRRRSPRFVPQLPDPRDRCRGPSRPIRGPGVRHCTPPFRRGLLAHAPGRPRVRRDRVEEHDGVGVRGCGAGRRPADHPDDRGASRYR